MIARRIKKTGDGTHCRNKHIWGFGDADISKIDQQELDQMHT